MTIKQKYMDMRATLTEIKYVPDDLVFLKVFLCGKLQGYLKYLLDRDFPVDEDIENEVRYYIAINKVGDS